MRIIEILDSIDLQIQTSTLETETDNQIVFSLLNSVEHYHGIRFPKKKIIWVTNLTDKEIYYSIELSPLRHIELDPHSCNETSFFFGGDVNSLYQFSNINIIAFIKEPFPDKDGLDITVSNDKKSDEKENIIHIRNLDDFPCPEILFMKICHHSKLTFFNCVFHNNTEKIYRIETFHDAVVEFINCEFLGKFIFVNNHDSIIVRH